MKKKQKTKLRKSTRYIYFFVAIILLAFSVSNLFSISQKENVRNTRKEIYSYTNKYNYNYNVKLIKNNYYDKDVLEMGQAAYVTDLINNIDLNIKYKYTGSATSNINYEYKVIGKTIVVYTRDGEEQKIMEKEEVLKDENNTSPSGNIDIDDTLNLNMKSKNDFIKNFEQNMGMTLDASYVLTVQVNTNTNIEKQDVANSYLSDISIDLGQKTTKITGGNNKEDTEYVTKEYAQKENTPVYKVVIYGILVIVSIVMLNKASKTQNINRTKNEYRQELNRILRICQDKIVKVRTKPVIVQANLVEVKDLGEIIKLAEELFKPILFWEDQEKEEAWFTVMSNDVIYRYILRK